MSSKKEELKKLKQPDAFQKEMFQVGDWVVKHKKTLISAIAPVVGIAVLVVLWGGVQFLPKRTATSKIRSSGYCF